MALLDRVRVRTGSDMPDAELQAMIDGIAIDIATRFGASGEITVTLGDLTDPASRSSRTLRVARPIDTGEAVLLVEIDPGNSGLAGNRLTLAADDFAIVHGGRTLQRLTGGTNGREFWAPLVELTYTPIGESAARDEATIKLIQLDLSYRGGLKSERAGDYQYTLAADVAAEREAIFEALAQRRGLVMA